MQGQKSKIRCEPPLIIKRCTPIYIGFYGTGIQHWHSTLPEISISTLVFGPMPLKVQCAHRSAAGCELTAAAFSLMRTSLIRVPPHKFLANLRLYRLASSQSAVLSTYSQTGKQEG
ncbi:hypothetical protein ABBQ38_006665 [Trebouxia sp. C0009 RCD-2024]